MRIFNIKEGHYESSGFHFGLHFGRTSQRYRVKFDSSCLYKQIDWENDWNKLCGWSYGDHRKNSIRVGWRAYNNMIELCIYLHEDSKISQSISTIKVFTNLEYNINLYHSGNQVILKVTGGTIYNNSEPIIIRFEAKPYWGYNLYPYFGGSNPSPHNMKIELERI